MTTAKRVGLEAVGWLLLVVGIAALVLPGPGLLMVFAGIAVLSQRYVWAERRVDPVKYRALKAAAEGVMTYPRILVSVGGVVLLLAAGALWIASPPAPVWWPVRESWWLLGGFPVAITQIVSAIVAAALLVYSYVRFHGRPEAMAELQEDIERADAKFRQRTEE